MRYAFLLFLSVWLAACTTVAPKEAPAEAPKAVIAEPEPAVVPTAWRHVGKAGGSVIAPWWNALNDEPLNALVTQALIANPDVHVAEARLGQIESVVAEADQDEQPAAQAALHAAEYDVRVLRQGVIHAMVATYLEARLAESRQELLHQRMQLARQLTEALHKRLMAGIASTGPLREQESAEVEIRQAKVRARHEYDRAKARLAVLQGLTPVEFTLNAGKYPAGLALEPAVDAPADVVDRRADVQAAWQRLLAVNAGQTANDDDDDATIMTQIEQTESSVANRDALYRKSVLIALQDVESAMTDWHQAGLESQNSQDALELMTANVHDTQRAVAAGRLSRVESLKAELAENQAQENSLTAAHARLLAYAALQLALARD